MKKIVLFSLTYALLVNSNYVLSGPDKSEAFRICKARVQSKVGRYKGSQESIYKQMSQDLSSCMAGYGF